MKALLLFASGVASGLAIAVLVVLAGWFAEPQVAPTPAASRSEPEPTWTSAAEAPPVPAPNLSTDGTPKRAVLRTTITDATGLVELETAMAFPDLDSAWQPGRSKDPCSHMTTRDVVRVESRPDVFAVHAASHDGFSGVVAEFEFGPGRADARVRVLSFGDVGPPFAHEWAALNGLIRYSSWPLDKPGVVIDFDLHGVLHGRWQSFAGSFLPPLQLVRDR